MKPHRIARWGLAALLPTLPLFAQAPAESDHWSAADLDAFAEAIAAGRPGPGRLIDRDHYFSALSHREPGPGFSESHRDWVDVYFVTAGTGTLVVGGTIPNGTENTPGEVRGTSIDGGERLRLAEGDVVHIPTGVPHHVIIEPGEQLTYYLLKIRDAE